MKERRVKSTEKAIQAAFAKLLSEKNIENIMHIFETNRELSIQLIINSAL